MTNWFKSIFGWFKKPVVPESPPRKHVPQPAPSMPGREPESCEPSTVRYQESSDLAHPPAHPTPSPQPVADLTIGFDLGTSCSKVAIGDSMLGNQHGVPFNTRAHGVAKYLLPTRFYEGAGGISLSSSPQTTLVSNLKLRLIEAVENQGDTSAPETDLAIFVALVLKHTLAWYEQHRAGDHRARERCWWLSFGFPAKRVDNNPPLHDAYQRFA